MRHATGVWFGAGLFLAGVAASAFFLVARAVVLPAYAGGDWPTYIGLGLILLFAWAFSVNRAGAGALPAPAAGADREFAEESGNAAASVQAEKESSEHDAGTWAWMVVLVAAVIAVLQWVETVSRFRGGVPDLFHAGLTCGVTLVFVGAVLLLLTVRPGGWPRVNDGGVGGAAGMAAAGLALGLVHGAVAVLPVDATTVEGRDGFAAPPASVGGIGWTWEVPEGQYVQDAVAAGAGLVVRIGDGLVAVDGEAGEQLWHYRRSGALAERLLASVDGGTVMVLFADGREEGASAGRYAVLDAHTGRVRSEGVRPEPLRDASSQVDLFEDGYVRGDGSSYLTGHSFDSAEETWRLGSPEGCEDANTGRTGARSVVVVVHLCAETWDTDSRVVAVGLDPVDGSEVWRYERGTGRGIQEIKDRGLFTEVRTSGDGDAVALVWESPGDEGPEGRTAVLDQADGTVIAEGIEEALHRLDRGSDRVSRQPNNGFTAEGYLVSSDRSEPPVEYTWNPFDGGEPMRTAPLDQQGDSELPLLRAGAALRDMLVTTEPLYWRDGGAFAGPASLTVHGAPWGGGEPWETEVGFDMHEDAPVTEWPESTPLLRVPGALAVVHGGATSVVGLV